MVTPGVVVLVTTTAVLVHLRGAHAEEGAITARGLGYASMVTLLTKYYIISINHQRICELFAPNYRSFCSYQLVRINSGYSFVKQFDNIKSLLQKTLKNYTGQ